MLPHADGEVLDDEVVIIHSSGPRGEPEVFEPNAWVCLPSVFGDVGGRPKTLWEWCSPDTSAEGPWPRALRARALVVRPATAPGEHFTASLDGLAETRVTCYHTVDIFITSSLTPVVDDAAGVLVWIGPLVYRWLAWNRQQVGSWHNCRTLSRA